MKREPIIAVSPAFFISRYGNRFTPVQVIEGLGELQNLGFDGFELEVYHEDTIEEWTSHGFAAVVDAASGMQLQVTQCVGHVLLSAFLNEEMLESGWGISEAGALADAISETDCSLVTIPIPAFQTHPETQYSAPHWRKLHDRFSQKLTEMAVTIQSRSLRVALEILPFSLMGGLHGLLGFLDHFRDTKVGASADIGLNLDTGHAMAGKELLASVVSRLEGHVFGTHLCDNFGQENLSLAPGKGLIEWTGVLSTLKSVRYSGSYDIEIHCKPSEVRTEYGAAKEFIHRILEEVDVT